MTIFIIIGAIFVIGMIVTSTLFYIKSKNSQTDNTLEQPVVSDTQLVENIKRKLDNLNNVSGNSTSVKCEYCGSDIKDDEKKCSHCGAVKK